MNSEEEKDTIMTKENFSENIPIPIDRKIRWIVFILIISLGITVSSDQGILSSTTTEIKNDYGMTDVELGGFGGMVFLGSAIGCVFSFTLINKYHRKYLLIITVAMDALAMFFTTKTSNIFLLYTCRVISGFSSSFLSIYSPVWSDQYGIHSKKSLMMSLIHISNVLGYMLGYGLGAWLGWKIPIYSQVIVLIVQIIIIAFLIPSKLFSSTLIPLKGKISQENNNDSNNLINNNNINDDNLNNNLKDDISLFEDIEKSNKTFDNSIFTHVKVLAKSPIFILENICLTSIFIIVSGVQFWINDYIENVIGVADKALRLLTFAIIVATSPILGILAGGVLSQKIGGYDTEKAIYIPLIASFFVCVLANIVIFVKINILFAVFFWFYLFFGSVVLPVANGIVLCSVDKQYSGSASALTDFIYNILGRLIGPNYYSWFKTLVNDKRSKIPMWFLLNAAIIGFIANLICVKYQKKKYRLLREEGSVKEKVKMEMSYKNDE